jgi:hypothetical protein
MPQVATEVLTIDIRVIDGKIYCPNRRASKYDEVFWVCDTHHWRVEFNKGGSPFTALGFGNKPGAKEGDLVEWPGVYDYTVYAEGCEPLDPVLRVDEEI